AGRSVQGESARAHPREPGGPPPLPHHPHRRGKGPRSARRGAHQGDRGAPPRGPLRRRVRHRGAAPRPGGLARLRLPRRRAPARLHRARVLPPPLDRRRLPPAPLPRHTPACAPDRLRGPGGRGDLHQRPRALHAAPRARATTRAHGLRLLSPRVRLALGREPDGRAPAPRPGAPLRPPFRRGSRRRLELDRRSPRPDARLGDERQRRARGRLPRRQILLRAPPGRGAALPAAGRGPGGRVRRRGAGVAQELRLPVRRPALRLRLRGPLQEPGRAAARGPGLPARAAARRRALAAPPERGAGFLGMRRLRRWLARLLVAMLLMALALAVGSRTGAVRALERSAVVHFLERATDARVRLGQVGGTLGHSLVLEDLRLAAGGRTVVHVPRLEIVYAPLALLRGVLRLERVTLTAPRVRAVREGGARPFALQPGGGLAVEV